MRIRYAYPITIHLTSTLLFYSVEKAKMLHFSSGLISNSERSERSNF